MTLALELSGLALHVLAQKWATSLKGGYIQHLRAVGEETFVLKIRTREKNESILIRLPSIVTITTRKWEPLDTQPPFVNATKAQLDNARIEEVTQFGLDRILAIKTERGSLMIELFGEGNLVLINEQGKITFVHHAREWKGRTLKMNHPYKAPAGPPAWENLPEKIEDLPEIRSGQTVGGWLITQLGVPSFRVREFCEEILRTPQDEKPLSLGEWKKLRGRLATEWKKVPETFILETEKEKTRVFPGKEKGAVSLSELFEKMEQSTMEKRHEEAVHANPKRESEKKALQVNLERQRAQVEAWKQKADELQKNGEWIYENFTLVEELLAGLSRAKKKKLDDKVVLAATRKHVQMVSRVDMANEKVELDEE